MQELIRHKSEADQARWLKEFESQNLEVSSDSIRQMEAAPFAEGFNAQLFRASFESGTVAVKQFDLSKIPPREIEDVRNKFKMEAALQSSLHNRKIIKVFGACTTREGSLLLVME